MRAFVLEGSSTGLQGDRPRPEPAEGYVRVRTLAAGVCNTDLELARGYMGFNGVLGHEFVGEALDGDLAGRRVVGGINFGCGACPDCERGMSRHCATRKVLGILGADGVMADEFVIPERNLVAAPDSMSVETAVFTEPVAAACEILEQIGDSFPRDRALVLGDGKLGPLIAQVLASDGFDVTLVGRHLESIAWVKELGVRPVSEVGDRPAFGLVVEATGSAEGLRRAISVTVPRGTVVMKTTVADMHEIDLAPVVINEINLLGSRCGRFEPAIERLSDGRVRVEPLIAAAYGLGDAAEAFEHASQRGVRKVLIRND